MANRSEEVAAKMNVIRGSVQQMRAQVPQGDPASAAGINTALNLAEAVLELVAGMAEDVAAMREAVEAIEKGR